MSKDTDDSDSSERHPAGRRRDYDDSADTMPAKDVAVLKRIMADVEKIEDKEVRDLVRDDLIRAFATPGDILTLGDRLMAAYHNAEQGRDGHSLDAARRDAEYYMLGLAAAATHNPILEAQIRGGAVYDAAKNFAFLLKDNGMPQAEWLLRTNKDQALSRPGNGNALAQQGLRLGQTIEGDQSFKMPRLQRRDMGTPQFNKP